MLHFVYLRNMKIHNANKLLSEKKISTTRFRIKLLNCFLESKDSISIDKLIKKYKPIVNKTTVYRALQCFENKGLIHKVPNKNNITKYSLCGMKKCPNELHSNNHGHFVCYACDKTYCLEDFKMIKPSFSGHIIKEIKVIYEGYCKACNNLKGAISNV